MARYYIHRVACFAPQSTAEPTPVPKKMPPRALRRLTSTSKMVLAVMEQALTNFSTSQPLSTVFATSNGDPDILRDNCMALADDDAMISPIKFSYSLLNAVAGVWSIEHGSQQRSISLSAHQYTAGVGLLEALMQLQLTGDAVLLVCYDAKTPMPVDEVYHISHDMACALLLTPQRLPDSLASVDYRIDKVSTNNENHSFCNQVAQLLPLMQVSSQPLEHRIVLSGSQSLLLETLC